MLTADRDYGVRVIRAYENKRVGQVLYPPGLLRDALVRRGFVERIKSSNSSAEAGHDDLPAKPKKRASADKAS